MEYSELVSLGYLALCKLALRFVESRGEWFHFLSVALPRAVWDEVRRLIGVKRPGEVNRVVDRVQAPDRSLEHVEEFEWQIADFTAAQQVLLRDLCLDDCTPGESAERNSTSSVAAYRTLQRVRRAVA